MTSWAHSGMYGTAVVLGPTQEAVYRFVLSATEHGRRPSFALRAIAEATGKPVSSVHEALGRLRALGLIGCAARMGRTGGHRLWRIVSSPMGALDAVRHRRAAARILSRWRERARGVATATERRPVDRPTDIPSGDDGDGGVTHLTLPLRTGPSFGDAMRQAGFRPFWDTEVEALPDGHDDTSDIRGPVDAPIGRTPLDPGTTRGGLGTHRPRSG